MSRIKLRVEKATVVSALIAMILSTGCSTSRNTLPSRTFHELTTRYNVYFNAEQDYNTQLKELISQHEDDYTKPLPFYVPLTRHGKTSKEGPFDNIIVKTEKAIREHSITSKPHRDPTKAQSQEYRRWLQQEEFNPFLKKVWLLHGKALLLNGESDKALLVFSHILRTFQDDQELRDETEIWMLRTCTEAERYYEAEMIAYTLRRKKFPKNLQNLFHEHYAFFLIQRADYDTAIPYLQMVIPAQSNSMQKKRLQFLVGQLYALTGQPDASQQAFKKVAGITSPTTMRRYATVWLSAVATGKNQQKYLRALSRHFGETSNLRDSLLTGNKDPISPTNATLLPKEKSMADIAAEHRLFRQRNGLWRINPNAHNNHPPVFETFDTNRNCPHSLLLTISPEKNNKNLLLYATARFNFSKFKLRKFEINPTRLPSGETLKISTFHTFEEASQYATMLMSDSLFITVRGNTTALIISESNLKYLISGNLSENDARFVVRIQPSITSPLLQAEKSIQRQATQEVADKSKKIVSLMYERTSPEEIRQKLEENASRALSENQTKTTAKSRRKQLKEREKIRREKLRQKEQKLKERQREREEAIKQREKERKQKMKEKQ